MQSQTMGQVLKVIGECRELGHDPVSWRLHLSQQLAQLTQGKIVQYGVVPFDPISMLNAKQSEESTVVDVDGLVYPEAIHQTTAGFQRPPIVSTGWATYSDAALIADYIQSGLLAQDELSLAFSQSGKMTGASNQLIDEKHWSMLSLSNDWFKPAGIGHMLISVRPIIFERGMMLDILTIGREDDGKPISEDAVKLVDVVHTEIARLIGTVLSPGRTPSRFDLSPRKQQVFDILMDGLSDKQIAVELGLSPYTVQEYVRAICQHFGVSGRVELMAWVLRHMQGRLDGQSIVMPSSEPVSPASNGKRNRSSGAAAVDPWAQLESWYDNGTIICPPDLAVQVPGGQRINMQS